MNTAALESFEGPRVFSKKLEKYIGKLVVLMVGHGLDNEKLMAKILEVGVDYVEIHGLAGNHETVLNTVIKLNIVNSCRPLKMDEIKEYSHFFESKYEGEG